MQCIVLRHDLQTDAESALGHAYFECRQADLKAGTNHLPFSGLTPRMVVPVKTSRGSHTACTRYVDEGFVSQRCDEICEGHGTTKPPMHPSL